MPKYFETVEDLVEFVVGNPSNASRRWKLDSYTKDVWDDFVDGAAWDKDRSQLGYRCSADPDYLEYVEKEIRLFARKPPSHKQTTWTLVESGLGSYRYNHRRLSERLGEALAGIWTEKLARYTTRMERVGQLSIPGMLKRLGMTGLKKQIKDAQTKIDNQMAKNKRNYARTQARELAEKLIVLEEKNPEVAWPASYGWLSEIVTMEMEE